MNIKSKLFFGISLSLILPLVYFVFDRTLFVRTAERTVAMVSGISSRNTSCGSRRSRHACTKYRATLRFELQGREYWLEVSAGSQRGLNQPVTSANYRVGEREYVKYDPRRPMRAYRDSFWDIWGAPVWTFVLQIATFVASFADRGKQQQEELRFSSKLKRPWKRA